MRRFITLILPFAVLFAAVPAGAGGSGSVGNDGNPPATLNPGDENATGAFAGPVFIELRDIPNVGTSTPLPLGGRFMRVTSRIGDGDSFVLLYADFVCGDPAVADPCSEELICTIGKGHKENCELDLIVDLAKSVEIKAVAVSLLIPQIVARFGLDPGTVLELTKLKKYVQDGPIGDVDGVLSFVAVMDAGFDAQ
jgi:hypothetical protein